MTIAAKKCTYRVACDCGWVGYTRHAEVKQHHACPQCSGKLDHRPATDAELAKLRSANA